MRLNGHGTPDEITLVPLNKKETSQPTLESKPAENRNQNNEKGYCFYCNKFGHCKAEYRKMKSDEWQQTRKNNDQNKSSAGNSLKCNICGKPHKTEDCWSGANSANDPRPKHNIQQENKTHTSVQPTTTKTTDESKN